MDTKKYPQARYYSSLSRSLSEIGTDWEAIVKDMNNADEYLNTGVKEEEKVEIYTTLSKIYRANAYGIQNVGEKPYDKSIELLDKADEILKSPYIEKELKDRYLPEVYLGLADAYYRRANINLQDKRARDDLYEAVTQSILFENRIGDIYRTLGEYDRAAMQYKDIIKKYPTDATAYISLSTMLLIDMKDVRASVEVYKDASVLPDIESNSNFVSLKNKLQNIGGI